MELMLNLDDYLIREDLRVAAVPRKGEIVVIEVQGTNTMFEVERVH